MKACSWRRSVAKVVFVAAKCCESKFRFGEVLRKWFLRRSIAKLVFGEVQRKKVLQRRSFEKVGLAYARIQMHVFGEVIQMHYLEKQKKCESLRIHPSH